MNFAARSLVGFLKGFIVFFGLQISAFAQEVQCEVLGRSISQCVLIEHHPSGPKVTTDWRGTLDKAPYKREIKGARSGSGVIGGSRLLVDANHNWMLIQTNGAKITLLSSSEKPPTVIRRFRESGYLWTIRVNKQDTPIEIVGVATEGERKLDLEITRIP